MSTLNVYGTVFSGKGDGKKFLSLPWVKNQIEEKTGFTPFEGTLNLRLTKENVKKKELAEKGQKMKIEPAQGYCAGFLVKAQVGNVLAAVVLPIVPNYPSDVLEVVAPICLRQELGLRDGSEVAVTFVV
jgi:riboflavin kinase, archaea type